MKKIFILLTLFTSIAQAKGVVGSPEVSINTSGNYLISIQIKIKIIKNQIQFQIYKLQHPSSIFHHLNFLKTCINPFHNVFL